MAKRKREDPDETPDAPEVTEPGDEPTEGPADEPTPPAPEPEPPAEIAVDFGDGTYQLIPAPNGVTRAISVVIGGQTYAHVAEHQGRWAYRAVSG